MAEETGDAYGYCYQNPINLTDPTRMSAEGDGIYRNNDTHEVVWMDGDGPQEGYTLLENYKSSVGTLPNLIIGEPEKEYTWEAFKWDVHISCSKADRWAESWGKDMGQFIANMHPLIAATNAYGVATDGKDIYGQEIGGTEASIQVAASVLPFLKVGKLFTGALK